ncbi:MAG: NEW3 domain-containing protein [Thermoplasmatota archaeon]
MKTVQMGEWKRLFQIFLVIILITSGLGVMIYYAPLGSSATAYDVSLVVDKASKEVSGGSQVNYAFTITNEGNNGDRYNIASTVSSSPSTWTVTLSKTSTSNIASGNTDTFTATVRAPTGVNISAYCFATIKVTSQTDPTNSSQSVLLSTIIKRTYGVSISSPGIKSTNPGGSVSYNFSVKNEGNDQDGYRLEATTIPTGWSASIDFDTGKIQPGATKAASMTIQAPTNAKAQSYQFVVKAQSITDSNTSATRTITVNINQVYRLSIQSEGVKQVDITTQTVVSFNVQITNLGNGEDQFSLQYYIPPQFVTAGWGGDLSTTTTSKVKADGKVNITFFAYPPSKSLRPAVNSKGEFYINATSVGDSSIKRQVKVSCVVQPFYDVRLLNTGASLQSVNADASTVFTFNVTNTGNDQDSFDFTVTAPEGFQDTSIEPSSITLARDGFQKVTVTVTPDADVVLAQNYNFKIEAKSTHGPTASSNFQVKINKKYGAFLDAPNGAIITKAQPGSTYSMMVRLQNKGNGMDSFNLAVKGATTEINSNWSPLISAATTPLLNANQLYYFNITATAPSTATEGTYGFVVNASSQNSPVFKTITLSIRIPQIYAVDISANKESVKGAFSNNSGAPVKVAFNLDVYNRGSGTDSSVSISVKSAPTGFAGLYSIFFTENTKSKISITSDSSKAAKLEVETPKISSGIAAGTYQFVVEARSDNGTLSNLNDDKTMDIVLNLVLQPVHRVRILAGINSSQVSIGDSVVFSVIIQNRGTVDDDFQLTVSNPNYGPNVKWSVPNNDLTTRVLKPLEQQTINLTASILNGADPKWGSVWAKVTATHPEDQTITDERYFTAIFADDFSGEISTDDNFEQALPGNVASYSLFVVNRGTRPTDTITIEVEKTSVSDKFDNIEITPSLIVMASNQRSAIWVNVSVPSIDDQIIETGTYDLIFRAVSEGETSQETDDVVIGNTTLKLKVMPVYKVQFLIPEGSKSADPGTKLNNIKLNVTNKGNEPATINVNLKSTNPGGLSNWVSISPATISDLAPNGAKDVIATFDVKSNAIAGKVEFVFNASVSGKSAYSHATFEIDVNQEFEPELTVPTGSTVKEAEPGDPVSFTVKLQNKGNDVDGFDIEMTSTKSDWVDFGFDGSTPESPETSIDNMVIDGAKNIWVSIEVDPAAAAGDVTFTLKATSKGDSAATDTLQLKVTVLPNRDVELVTSEETKEMIPDVDQRDTEIQYEITVLNKGEAADTFKIELLETGMTKPAGVDQARWDAIVGADQFSEHPEWVILSKKVTNSIGKGLSEKITVTIRVPDSNYDPGEFNTYVWAYSEGEVASEDKYSDPIKLTTKIKQAYGADIRGNELQRTYEDENDPTMLYALFEIEVKNTGTGFDNFQIEIDEDLNDDFEFIYPNGKTINNVDDNDIEKLQIRIEMPADTLTGKYTFRARWMSEGDTDGFKEADGDYTTEWKEFTIDVRQTYGVEIEAESEKIEGRVGENKVFTLTLSNLGNDDDTFRIDVRPEDPNTENWWSTSNSKLSLDAKGRTNDQKEFTLTISIPNDNEDALAGYYYFNVTIVRDATTRTEQNRATTYIILRLEVLELYEHILETEDLPEEAMPGEIVSYRFKVQNRANIDDTFELDVKGTKSEWAKLQYTEVNLQAKGMDDVIWVWLNITIPSLDEVSDPNDVEAGSYDFTVEVKSQGDREKVPETLEFEIDVEQKFGVDISEVKEAGEATNPKKWNVNDEDELEIEIVLANAGNSDDTYYIKKPSNPNGWDIIISQSHVPIPMDDEKTITVTIDFFPTDGFVNGLQPLRFEVIPDDGSTQGKKEREYFTLYIDAQVPELVVRDDSIILPSDITPGQVNEVTVTVYNTGTATAEDVEVTLYDGKQSYRADKKNIGDGSKGNFTFDWKPNAGEHKLEVRVNEGDLIIELDTDNNEVEKKTTISQWQFTQWLENVWVVVVLLVLFLIVVIALVFMAMNKNREIRELEEIITKLKVEGGPGGPRKVIKEAAGAPMAPKSAVGRPAAPGKLAPVGGPSDAGKKENVKVQCPKCMTQQVVSIDKRPAEVPCKECGVTLVIPEKKK